MNGYQSSNKLKVLYIMGAGRSGSTIFGNTLGQLENFTHVGEILEIWTILASRLVLCGCGAPVVTCKTWEDVLRRAYGHVDESFIVEMVEFRNSRACDSTFLNAMSSRGIRILQQSLAKPLAEIESLYRSIQETFGCEVIVDSSKHPMYGYLLHLIDSIDPYVVHLTRDPRAVAYSFFRKQVKDGSLIWKRDLSPVQASLKWNYKNGVAEILSKRFRRYPLHVRYEDFVADPRGSLQRVLNFVGEPRLSFPLEDEHSVNLVPQHTVSGNPSRFVTGKVELRQNHSWKSEMTRRDQMLVTAATWPLMIKYGYWGNRATMQNPLLGRAA
jgi:Sulfotransferase family